jgi:transcriptional regulator with XRE-family HTH domain
MRKARTSAGLTRNVVVQRMGGGQTAAREIESGERVPTVGSVTRIASVLGVSAGWLGYGIGEQQTDGSAATTDGMGARIAAVRIERGLTKAALARLVDLSPSSFAKIENGGQTGVDVLEALAKALGVSPAWLAFGEGPRDLPKKRRTNTVRIQSAHADQ